MTEEQQASPEATQDIVVRCTKCGGTFAPDLKLRKDPWYCIHCEAKNPNLRRLFRGVADVFIVGLILTVIFFPAHLSTQGLGALRTWISAFWIVFLLVCIIRIYRSRTPWLDPVSRTLVWLVFVLAFALNVVLPLLQGGDALALVVPAFIVYLIVFAYVLWLLRATRRARVVQSEEAGD